MEDPDTGFEDEHRWVVDVHNAVLAAEVVLDDLLFEVDVSILLYFSALPAHAQCSKC